MKIPTLNFAANQPSLKTDDDDIKKTPEKKTRVVDINLHAVNTIKKHAIFPRVLRFKDAKNEQPPQIQKVAPPTLSKEVQTLYHNTLEQVQKLRDAIKSVNFTWEFEKGEGNRRVPSFEEIEPIVKPVLFLMDNKSKLYSYPDYLNAIEEDIKSCTNDLLERIYSQALDYHTNNIKNIPENDKLLCDLHIEGLKKPINRIKELRDMLDINLNSSSGRKASDDEIRMFKFFMVYFNKLGYNRS